jgi:hypothetical protein
LKAIKPNAVLSGTIRRSFISQFRIKMEER